MDDLGELLDLQSGVVARRQALACGLKPSDIRRLVRRREWRLVHPGVYVDHTGALSWVQRAWAAVLYAWPAALTHRSALRAVEGPGRQGEDDSGAIHVAVSHTRRVETQPGIRIHRTSHFAARAQHNTSPPMVRYEEAVVDVMSELSDPWERIELLARACRIRRTTAARLHDAVAGRTRMRDREWTLALLDDIAGGVCSVLEHAYLVKVERAHGLPRATRQRAVEATVGLTYRDAESHGLALELDGRLFHDTASQRDRDMDRDLDAWVAGDKPVRIGYGQVFRRPCETAARLARLLQRGGWRGVPRACGPDCAISTGSIEVTG